ncbi:MAG: hypothetical protein IJD86_08995 [Clostridia bacterium]|nr:hypothetical protein [Clostridia bacterium]
MPMMLPWKKKKLIQQLNKDFGKKPEKDYDPGDMKCIRSYYDACRKNVRDSFYVDETTWNDLNVDDIYKQINSCQCTAGEQYLYYMLRRPMNKSAYDKQLGLIHFVQEHPDVRLKIQLLLSRIGNYRHIDLTSVFRPAGASSFWLLLYLFMDLLLIVSVFAPVLFGQAFIFVPIAFFIANSLFHELRRIRCEHEITRVNYCVSLALSLRKMKKWKIANLDAHLPEAYAHLDQMKPFLRSGPVMSRLNADPLQEAMVNFFLLDLISFEILKKRLSKYHDHFLAVHEAVGKIDASIAIASYRASQRTWCEPIINYSNDQPAIQAQGIVHPLMENAVPNDLAMGKSMLITGSNASGKSTYLRSAILCALMAETLCTCPCVNYRGSFFRIYTSMALTDNLMAGESYYIAEIKSIKRILDAQKQKGFVLCALDEVLRGTNTIERISASAEILNALSQPGTLCIVATHDAELCLLTYAQYQLAHFEETVTDDAICFDYKLKKGPANTRNAIHLLKMLGFDHSIIDAAHRRADTYVKTGKWMEPDAIG